MWVHIVSYSSPCFYFIQHVRLSATMPLTTKYDKWKIVPQSEAEKQTLELNSNVDVGIMRPAILNK